MILNDVHLRKRCQQGLIEPYDETAIQPASIDLHLSDRWRVFDRERTTHVDLGDPSSYEHLTKPLRRTEFVLHPGEFVLGGTEELVHMPTDLVGRVEGKSSLGRLGLIVHATAGFFDPGFSGRATLEMANLAPVPIVLRSGVFICQMSFHLMVAPASKPYDGRYQDDTEVAASRF